MIPAPEDQEELVARVIKPVFAQAPAEEEYYTEEEVDGALARSMTVLRLRAEAEA
ncbi:MAG: hypothetical protein HQK86_13930 [Nitrospinae bacterium]|nr:hypothetical protein [Nitrospinota bacterium]